MKDIITVLWIKAFIVISVLSINTYGHPSSEELSRGRVKNIPPTMQTLLSDIAKELISRSTASNQVLTLNFTNLLILLVMKGLLWGASYAGVTGHPKARSGNESPEPLMTETEILLLLSYLMGDEDDNFDCLHRIACEDPSKASEYVNAGSIVMRAAKFIGLNTASDVKYEKMLKQLEEVVKFKENGGKCKTKYSCNRETENVT